MAPNTQQAEQMALDSQAKYGIRTAEESKKFIETEHGKKAFAAMLLNAGMEQAAMERLFKAQNDARLREIESSERDVKSAPLVGQTRNESDQDYKLRILPEVKKLSEELDVINNDLENSIEANDNIIKRLTGEMDTLIKESKALQEQQKALIKVIDDPKASPEEKINATRKMGTIVERSQEIMMSLESVRVQLDMVTVNSKDLIDRAGKNLEQIESLGFEYANSPKLQQNMERGQRQAESANELNSGAEKEQQSILEFLLKAKNSISKVVFEIDSSLHQAGPDKYPEPSAPVYIEIPEATPVAIALYAAEEATPEQIATLPRAKAEAVKPVYARKIDDDQAEDKHSYRPSK